MSDEQPAHVLFVDDEPRILDGLRRSLRGMRHDWQMRFAGGGAEALLMLEQGPCDVLVSDMRMPHMDGAELLTRVRTLHPGVARVVLSGHTEPDAAVRAALVAHRFLSKPCDVDVLTQVITELTAGLSTRRAQQLREIGPGVVSQVTGPGIDVRCAL